MTTSRGFQALSLAAALLLGPAVARAGHHGVNVSIDDGDNAVRCDDIRIEIGNRPAARAEARTVIAVPAGGKALDVRAAQSSGVRVYGTDRADFEVLLCKAAPAGGDLDAIALTHDGGSVSVRGPAEGTWVGYLLIAAPRGAAVSVHSENGPVSLSALQGRVQANSQNGPISLDECTGDVDVQAQNGPIQVRGDEGRLHVRTQNGPIGVSLSGRRLEIRNARRERRERPREPGRGGRVPLGNGRRVARPLARAVPGRGVRGCAAHLERRRQADRDRRCTGRRAALDPQRAGHREDGSRRRTTRTTSSPLGLLGRPPRGTASSRPCRGSRRSSR